MGLTEGLQKRFQKQRRQLRAMLPEWLSGLARGEASLVPGERFRLAARKMRILGENRLGTLQPQTAARLGEAITGRFSDVRSLVHVHAGAKQEASTWSEVEQVLAGSGAGQKTAERSAVEDPNTLRPGSIIQKFNMFPGQGQTIPAFKQQAQGLPRAQRPQGSVDKPVIQPGSRLFARIQEISPKSKPDESEPGPAGEAFEQEEPAGPVSVPAFPEPDRPAALPPTQAEPQAKPAARPVEARVAAPNSPTNVVRRAVEPDSTPAPDVFPARLPAGPTQAGPGRDPSGMDLSTSDRSDLTGAEPAGSKPAARALEDALPAAQPEDRKDRLLSTQSADRPGLQKALPVKKAGAELRPSAAPKAAPAQQDEAQPGQARLLTAREVSRETPVRKLPAARLSQPSQLSPGLQKANAVSGTVQRAADAGLASVQEKNQPAEPSHRASQSPAGDLPFPQSQALSLPAEESLPGEAHPHLSPTADTVDLPGTPPAAPQPVFEHLRRRKQASRMLQPLQPPAAIMNKEALLVKPAEPLIAAGKYRTTASTQAGGAQVFSGAPGRMAGAALESGVQASEAPLTLPAPAGRPRGTASLENRAPALPLGGGMQPQGMPLARPVSASQPGRESLPASTTPAAPAATPPAPAPQAPASPAADAPSLPAVIPGGVVQRELDLKQKVSEAVGGVANSNSTDSAGPDLERIAEDVMPYVKRLLEIEAERTGRRA